MTRWKQTHWICKEVIIYQQTCKHCSWSDSFHQRSTSEALLALTAQYCTEPWDLQTHFLHYTYIFIQSSEENNFLSYLTFRQKYLKPLKFPFVWVQHSSARGKQAVLLESLFKESDLQWVPPTPAPSNGVFAPSCTKTSQARPFLHTRQKNAQCCSLLLPQMLLRMFGKKAEMTGTTIRLPYLEKMA